MSNLKLITTETFNALPCNFYRNMNDDILLTREQIGQALEYADPIDSIYRIHKRHQDRLDSLSVCLSDGLGHQIYYYTEKGVMEICRWSKSKRANEFMDWTWDIIEKYRHNELTPDLSQITSTLTSITNTLTTLTQTITSMQQEITTLKQPKQELPKKKWSYWSTKMFPKYQLLTDYFQISYKELYKNLYNEMKNTYPDIDLSQEIDDYCYENHLESCYTLDVIEHNKTLRRLFESIVDNLLEQNNLIDSNNINTKIPTIFDKAS